jgi:hypothetical protein
MYKTSYVCDCCGKEMTLPMYTLNLSTQSFCVQDQTNWHYCEECWPKIKETLNGKSDSEELKKENEKLKKDVQQYENFFNLVLKAFAEGFYGKSWAETGDSLKCSSGQENGLFSAGCCAEDINKCCSDYKQTVAPYSSLKL